MATTFTIGFSSHRPETTPLEEISPGDDPDPDARDELSLIQHVNRLRLDDCRRMVSYESAGFVEKLGLLRGMGLVYISETI